MFYQTHGLMKGDKYCRWIIERIKEDKKGFAGHLALSLGLPSD
jgi:hypothetical protein